MLVPTLRWLAAVSVAAVFLSAPLPAAAQSDTSALLDRILASDHRDPKNAARDRTGIRRRC
jgi:hypothetical protein